MTRSILVITTLLGFGCADPNNPNNGDGNTDDPGVTDPGNDTDDGTGNNNGTDPLESGSYGLVESGSGINLMDLETGETVESYSTEGYDTVDYFSVTGPATTWIQVDYDLGYGEIVKVPGSEMANVVYIPRVTFVDTTGSVYMMDYDGNSYRMVDGVLQSVSSRDCTYDGNDHACGNGRQISSDAFVWTKGESTYCDTIAQLATDTADCGSLPGTNYAGIGTVNGQLYGITEDGVLVTRVIYEDGSREDVTIAQLDIEPEMNISWSSGSTMYVVADGYLMGIELTTGSYTELTEVSDLPLALYVAE